MPAGYYDNYNIHNHEQDEKGHNPENISPNNRLCRRYTTMKKMEEENIDPGKTRHSPNVGLMFDQRRTWLTNINPALRIQRYSP